MELRQLKYFAKAAELQNFTEAASALFITQSTLSQQIKQLEDELSLPLFHRVAKRVRLTDAGKAFLPFAQKTLKNASDGKEMLRDLMDLRTGALSVGATYGLTDLLTKSVAVFSATFPGIKLLINFGTSEELLGQLEEGDLDMMLSFYENTHNQRVSSDHLFPSRLSLVAHASHPVARHEHVGLADLMQLPLILPSKGYSIRGYLDTLLRENNLQVSVNMEVNDIHTLLEFVRTGNWVTVLMSSTIASIPELKSIEISEVDMNRVATITWPKDAYRKNSAAALADLLQANAQAYR